ncbi:MAG: hypothetical protein IID44_11985 [Planctomycetes bacterium]|nr:hypothetical protein [Planctomycetota bacterium]
MPSAGRDLNGLMNRTVNIFSTAISAAELPGKVVSRLFLPFDMNDRGQVVFEVVFEDLSKAVVVATPSIPEPSSFVLAVIAVLLLLAARRKRRGANHFGAKNQFTRGTP